MRNLALVSSSTISFDNLHISATTIDLDENIVYAVSEKQSFDGEVGVELWKVGKIGITGLEGVKSPNTPRKSSSLDFDLLP
jgi:elongator complex protein 1